ncbi:MAG: MATE family efflux transporter, partial [Oscillospiraceae bacterium]|jgi:putative MATE family efflux protein|nr:MATE family efflux transporter [Oscillospiraceae bacterium]
MSGAALAIQLQFLLSSTLTGIASGAAVIASQYWGKRQIQPIRNVFAIAFCLGTAVGALLAVLGGLFPAPILRLLTNDEAVIAESALYLRVLAPSYPIFAFCTIGVAMFRSVERAQVGVYLSLVSLGLDAVLNYILIYGKLGFPSLGIQGAAIATVISYCAQFALLLICMHRRGQPLRTRFWDCFKAKKAYLKTYVKTSLPLVGSSLSWGVAMAVQTAILGRMGQQSIAANSIAATLTQVCSVVAYASAGASAVVVGKAVGQGDLQKVKNFARRLQILFLCIGVLSSGVLFLARSKILTLYAVSDGTAALAKQFLLVLCVTVFGTSYQMAALTGIVSGGGDTRFVLINDLIFMWGIVLPLALLAAFVWQLSPLIVFVVLKSDQITKCAVAVVKVNRFRWIRNLTNN